MLYTTSATALTFLRAAHTPLHTAMHVTAIDSLEGLADFIERRTEAHYVAALMEYAFSRTSRALSSGYTHYCMTVTDVQSVQCDDATEIRTSIRPPPSAVIHCLNPGAIDRHCVTSLTLVRGKRTHDAWYAWEVLKMALL